ncbi:hypothetical protein KFU94_65660 [Chloroflexi bacterium TSY]|nr:hypothetical protein [Chloroflexi bacterium TSY]
MLDSKFTDIAERVLQNACTPIIGNQLVMKTLFGADDVVAEWAERIGYPEADYKNTARVAQFLRTQEPLLSGKRKEMR